MAGMFCPVRYQDRIRDGQAEVTQKIIENSADLIT
jgi:hypothetical protein